MTAIVAVSGLVAVAVAMLFILGTTARHTTNSARATVGSHAPYVPLIQYPGTGQPPTAAASHSTPGARPTAGLLKANTPTAPCRRARGGSGGAPMRAPPAILPGAPAIRLHGGGSLSLPMLLT
jgi:hypothetical protein